MRPRRVHGYDYDHVVCADILAQARKVRELVGCPEDRGRLVRDHEPAAVVLLEYVRYEGVLASSENPRNNDIVVTARMLSRFIGPS